jgi:hypothetical protein
MIPPMEEGDKDEWLRVFALLAPGQTQEWYAAMWADFFAAAEAEQERAQSRAVFMLTGEAYAAWARKNG